MGEQLQNKFILCIEGNDVASNLKWAMSSNSLVFMTKKPKFETWFMEGTLIPGHHYVEIKDDYSDMIEKMDYYLSHRVKPRQSSTTPTGILRSFWIPVVRASFHC